MTNNKQSAQNVHSLILLAGKLSKYCNKANKSSTRRARALCVRVCARARVYVYA